jgi:hypothetical protein
MTRSRGFGNAIEIFGWNFRFAGVLALTWIRIHAYFGIDWEVVWRAAKNRCPVLREQVAGLLAREPGGPEVGL